MPRALAAHQFCSWAISLRVFFQIAIAAGFPVAQRMGLTARWLLPPRDTDVKVDEWEEVRENGELLENAIINTERFLADWAALRPTEQRLLVDQISWLPCTCGQGIHDLPTWPVAR